MKKSFMNNIKHFVDSNVRQRIDRAANNNNEFFGDDLLLLERQFEQIRHVCIETEKRISAMLQSLNLSPLGAYTHNVQASLNNLSSNLAATNTTIINQTSCAQSLTNPMLGNEAQSSSGKQINSSSKSKSTTISQSGESITMGNSSQSQTGTNDSTEQIRNDIRRHKKLPIVGFLKFLVKSCHKLKPDSLLATTLTHCSHLQIQLTKLYLSYEQTIESQCLKPVQHILEIDAPNVIKLRKLFIKSHNDLESVKAKYNGANLKQQQLQAGHFSSTSYTITQNNAQQANISKLDQLKKELEDAVTRFEQARDTYATELYAFVCRETELVNFFIKFYQYQAEYHQQVGDAIQSSLPSLNNIMANTSRKVVFGTSLEEHLRCTGRPVSLVIELSVHLLYSNGLNEEGLFRIPGSSVKIKKLKNAINAWFVTLASQSELDNDRQKFQIGNHSSVFAIHDLFKDIAGQRPERTAILGDTINNQSTTTRDDSTSTHTNLSSTQEHQQLLFDVHTIAGLLKLYLRELPEPLFTYALYDQWIDATVKTLNNEQPDALERVIGRLPKANHDNLHHLIRFLHLLTYHSEFNKMTATNLAITMAPSLIWDRPTNHQQSAEQQLLSVDHQQDDMQALNMHMSSVGISASLHAFVIENLINNAEKLLPGPVHFTLSGLNGVPASLCERNQRLLTNKQERCIKSTSPTGLSTTSSSSFSSASNASVTSSASKRRSRKGGSMDGLLNNSSDITLDTSSLVSVHNGREQSQTQRAPPVPPAPAMRSHSGQASDSSCPSRSFSIQKSSAPPLPTPNSLKRQQHDKCTNIHVEQLNYKPKIQTQAFSSIKHIDLDPAKSAISLRGTGSVSSQLTSNGSNNLNAMRPTVPPPDRPPKPFLEEMDGACSQNTRSEQSDKGSQSLASSCNLRANFEEINVDDISVSVSPVVSLDSISGDDSSFDNECRSLEHSWNESVLNHIHQADHGIDGDLNVKPSPRLLDTQQIKKHSNSEEVNECSEDRLTAPPVKPPRSISPKITQSTLL